MHVGMRKFSRDIFEREILGKTIINICYCCFFVVIVIASHHFSSGRFLLMSFMIIIANSTKNNQTHQCTHLRKKTGTKIIKIKCK